MNIFFFKSYKRKLRRVEHIKKSNTKCEMSILLYKKKILTHVIIIHHLYKLIRNGLISNLKITNLLRKSFLKRKLRTEITIFFTRASECKKLKNMDTVFLLREEAKMEIQNINKN